MEWMCERLRMQCLGRHGERPLRLAVWTELPMWDNKAGGGAVEVEECGWEFGEECWLDGGVE